MSNYTYSYTYDLYGKYFDSRKNEITQKQYILKTKESSFLINRLKYSVWPAQINDYVFLKMPFENKGLLLLPKNHLFKTF